MIGLPACIQIITPECRQNRGLEGAIDEALSRVRKAFLEYASAPDNADVNWNVLLILDDRLSA